MRFFVANRRARTKPASHLALAIALATGSAVAMAGFAEPAYAQKKKKKKKAEEARPQYSKEFVAAYQPLQDIVNAEGGDVSAARALIPSVQSLAVSPDEKMVTGNAIYNVGIKSGDQALQLQGMELMLASGKVAADQVGRFNFVAYQLSNNAGDYSKARNYLQNAIDANFSSENVTPDAMRIAMSEIFFSEGRHKEGLGFLQQAIAQRKAAGQTIEEQWYRRGLSVAYNNEVKPEVYDFVLNWVGDYSSTQNWRDAINISRNLANYEPGELLDLLRLGYRLDALTDKQEYIDYVESADPRRLPKEVETVIQNGYATGRVSRDDIFIADSLKIASGRIASDRADLPALERDARSSSAGLRTVVAAGDAFLSYNEPAKAAEFYSKSLGMPGVDTPQVLTRLGIAQTDMGNYAAARETFAKVQGDRHPIALLWAAYIDEKSAPAAAATAAPAAPVAETAAVTTEG